ncbi:efflux RND transporter permease subunit [Rhodopseudomonas palustris]|uniref:efflux RND transporter permease subunit n=1 Tax=Rhodopseudomonas palustris TaxID=1076 RepID=UPI000E5AB5AE|nr:efflux RND transporter permease subunit [Rhodopseudomonas palustris]QLH72011.1 efflux RND transporter permease subunit [Rhodopseudomonas palustris]RIA01585.1 efflux RND transporter permease subunit [Rhodopseudomonas palustris]
MFSRFFIERPVLSNTLAFLIVLLGALALMRLPVSQYPDVVPPTVSVSATYPGASARTVMDSVALPIEQQVNGVEGMIYMQSTSASDGSYNLVVTFDIGTDPNMAQVLVQNRVSLASAQLPTSVSTQGLNIKKKSTAILQFVSLVSSDGRYDNLFLANYAKINIQNELARLPGVGDVSVLGSGSYAMRIWLDPDKLQSYGLTPSDVISAVQQQSNQVTAGLVGGPPAPSIVNFQYALDVVGRFNEATDFEKIVVKAVDQGGGQLVRIGDIGRVELGASSYGQNATLDGKPSAAIAISLLTGANALSVAEAVNAKMKEMAGSFPAGLDYKVSFDSTKFITASVDEVYETLIIAAVLVLVVILMFLQDWRAMLVPATTVPVTIIGAFAAMSAMGFTVNTTSLFALVLAIGIVVDDAIVIVEGVSRHTAGGMSSREAAVKAMSELFGPIIGITLVLMAVFLPAAALPGLTGKMYQQFALVIAATALISAVNAVTLKPTQCALWLRAPVPPEQRGIVYRIFNAVYARCEAVYAALIRRLVAFSILTTIVGLVLVGVAFYGVSRVPTAFLPSEDQGYFIISLKLPDAASAGRSDAAVAKAVELVRKTPGVESVIGVSGVSPLDNNATMYNAGMLYVVLHDWDQRKTKDLSIDAIAAKVRAALGQLDTATALVLMPPPIQGIGNTGGFTMMVEMKNGSSDFLALQNATEQLAANASTQSGITHAASTFKGNVKQLRLVVDRMKAETLGVTVGQVFSAVESYLGSTYVNQFTKFNNVFQVYVQADAPFRLRPDDVLKLKVKGSNGQMVPVGAVAYLTDEVGPPLITLYNLYPAATLVGSPAAGFSSGEAMSLMSEVAAKSLPSSMGTAWTGMSYQEQVVGDQIYYVFAVALLLVYFVLAGQYESWLQPLAVILAVPLTLLGTVAALEWSGLPNDLYTQIGIVLLIALAAKNAILIVEYAREKCVEGMPIAEAAVEAARLRFRPILMTSFAFIFGMLPLALATGAGAGARVSLGIAVVAGMLASTGLAVLFVPAFFAVLQRLGTRREAAASPAEG